MSPSPPPPTFCSVLSESKRIFLAHHRHFLGLSVIFLLPLSAFNNIYYQLHRHSQALLRQYQSPTTATVNNNTTASIILPLIYNVVVVLLTNLAVGSVSFSAYNGLFDRPVKLVSSILSLLRSYLPLLLTYLASFLIFFLILFAFGLVLFLLIGLQYLGFAIDEPSHFLIVFCVSVTITLLLFVIVYLQVSWALASVVVVVESSWGFEPLRRSTKLVKEMRRLTLSLILFYGICSGLLLWGCSYLSDEFDGGDIMSWKTWSYVLRMVLGIGGGMALMLQYFLANTVLYVYCKAAHGEVAGEIAEKFGGNYVSLPFNDDDGKLYHVVSVMPTNELGMP